MVALILFLTSSLTSRMFPSSLFSPYPSIPIFFVTAGNTMSSQLPLVGGFRNGILSTPGSSSWFSCSSCSAWSSAPNVFDRCFELVVLPFPFPFLLAGLPSNGDFAFGPLFVPSGILFPALGGDVDDGCCRPLAVAARDACGVCEDCGPSLDGIFVLVPFVMVPRREEYGPAGMDDIPVGVVLIVVSSSI